MHPSHLHEICIYYIYTVPTVVPGIHYSEPASRAWSCYSGVWIRDRVEWLAQFAIFENLNIVVDQVYFFRSSIPKIGNFGRACGLGEMNLCLGLYSTVCTIVYLFCTYFVYTHFVIVFYLYSTVYTVYTKYFTIPSFHAQLICMYIKNIHIKSFCFHFLGL